MLCTPLITHSGRLVNWFITPFQTEKIVLSYIVQSIMKLLSGIAWALALHMNGISRWLF
jgi:hypothetical protein